MEAGRALSCFREVASDFLPLSPSLTHLLNCFSTLHMQFITSFKETYCLLCTGIYGAVHPCNQRFQIHVSFVEVGVTYFSTASQNGSGTEGVNY